MNKLLALIGIALLVAMVSLGCGVKTRAPLVYRVALIDNFYPGDEDFHNEAEKEVFLLGYGIDIDGDNLPEPILHGDLVEFFYQHPQIEVIRFSAPGRDDLVTGTLWALIEAGERFDAVSISAEFAIPRYVFTESYTDHDLKLEDKARYREIIRTMAQGKDKRFKAMEAILVAMERVAALGCPVYVPVGNRGISFVNTFSLAEGVVTVGAESETHWAANTPFVTLKGPVEFEVLRVWDGYDLNNDGKSDVSVDKSSSGGEGFGPNLKGTSFTLPVALVRHLTNE
jgi:hypothetical protein